MHNSLLAFTCNVSLYLAFNLLVEKSINNGPASSNQDRAKRAEVLVVGELPAKSQSA